MDLYGKKINFLGDSITEGCGTSGPDKCFVHLIAHQEGALCRNYGIGGSRIAAQLSCVDHPDWDPNYCKRVMTMDPDADIVLIFGGTNDYGHGDAPIGTWEDRTPNTFYGAVHTLCIRAIERYPQAEIVILTPLHRSEEELPSTDIQKTSPCLPLKGYVDIIRQVAEYYSLPVLDLFAVSGIQPAIESVKTRLIPDGLHPNDDGHVILAKKITAFLKAM